MRVLVISEWAVPLMIAMPIAEGLVDLYGGATLYRCTSTEIDREYTEHISDDTIHEFLKKDIIIAGRKAKWDRDIFTIVKNFRPDVVLCWNGAVGISTVLADLKKVARVIFCELGYFPQRNFVYMDREGINFNSSIRHRTSPPITEEQRNSLYSRIEAYKSKAASGDDFADRDYIFLPLQIEHDSQITVFSPHFKRMVDLVSFVSSTFPDERILVKPHPLDQHKYDSTWSNVQVVKDVNTHALIRNSKCVVGINSTVLLESTLYNKPVSALGNGIFTGKGVVLEAQTDPQIMRGVLEYQPDKDARDNFLYDLLFNYQVKIGEINDHNIVEKYDLDIEALRRWAETNLIGDGAAPIPSPGRLLDYLVGRSLARRVVKGILR